MEMIPNFEEVKTKPKKSIKIFGKVIPIWLLIALVIVGLGSAAIVTYLSNTKTITLSVESPMVMRFDSGDYADTATKDLGLIQGGETVTYKVWSWNKADVATSTYPITTIISNQDWTGNEFSSVIFKNAAYSGGIEILPMLYVVQINGDLKKFTDGNWDVVDKKSLKIFFDNDGNGIAQKYSQGAGIEDWNTLEIITNPLIAPGNYAVKLCHLNDLTGACV